MSSYSAEYIPQARGALKLKGEPSTKKPHRNKIKRKKVSDSKLDEPAQVQEREKEREKEGSDEQGDGDGEMSAGEGSREEGGAVDEDEIVGDGNGDGNGGEKETRGKTVAEMRHEERRKKKVCFVVSFSFFSSFLSFPLPSSSGPALFFLFYFP